MYVFCDACKENVVEDTKGPLRQIVPIHGDYVCKCYDAHPFTCLDSGYTLHHRPRNTGKHHLNRWNLSSQLVQ